MGQLGAWFRSLPFIGRFIIMISAVILLQWIALVVIARGNQPAPASISFQL